MTAKRMEADKRAEFIICRAEGLSLRATANKLDIGKTTCQRWDKELKQEIGETRRETIKTLLDAYSMHKQGRIKALGDTLKRINNALEKKNFEDMEPGRLLELKLKYMTELKDEYTGVTPAISGDLQDGKAVIIALGDLLDRVRAGDVPTDQVQKETAILMQMIRAFDTVEVKAKINEIEAYIQAQQETEKGAAK